METDLEERNDTLLINGTNTISKTFDFEITTSDNALAFFEGKDLPDLDGRGPKKLYKPIIGDIILFPSSLAHSTTPFKSDKKRVCIAFDLNPL